MFDRRRVRAIAQHQGAGRFRAEVRQQAKRILGTQVHLLRDDGAQPLFRKKIIEILFNWSIRCTIRMPAMLSMRRCERQRVIAGLAEEAAIASLPREPVVEVTAAPNAERIIRVWLMPQDKVPEAGTAKSPMATRNAPGQVRNRLPAIRSTEDATAAIAPCVHRARSFAQTPVGSRASSKDVMERQDRFSTNRLVMHAAECDQRLDSAFHAVQLKHAIHVAHLVKADIEEKIDPH